MNITYFIGNGYDLQMGAPTSYEDFYDYLEEKFSTRSKNTEGIGYKTENPIFIDILKHRKPGQTLKNRWSDMEMGLGKYTKDLDAEFMMPADFIRQYRELNNQLKQFLKGRETDFQQIEIVNTNFLVQVEFNSIIEHVLPENREAIEKFIKEHESEDFNAHFVSFNYTNLFDRVIISSQDVVLYQLGNQKKPIFIRDLIHIHGDLAEPILLGVDNKTQMNREFPGELDGLMIKPQANNLLKNNKNKRLREIIMNTKLFILFGLSLGETDETWWKEIVEGCLRNRGYIIFHYFDNGTSNQDVIAFKDSYNEAKKRILKYAKHLTESQQNELSERILITFNKCIFYDEKYQLPSKAKGEINK